MNLEIGPIFRAMMRNKVGAMLIMLQIAVTMTIIANGFSIIQERKALMARDSGVDIANSFHLSNVSFAEDFDMQTAVIDDLKAIRELPGVADAIQVNAIPLSGSGWSMGLQTEAGDDIDGSGTAVYMVDDHALSAYDVKLIAGRNFELTDLRWRTDNTNDWADVLIATEALTKSLFPDLTPQEVIGKTVFINNHEPIIIIGIIDKLQAPWSGWNNLDHVMLTPDRLAFRGNRYYIRAEEGVRDDVMKRVEETLSNRLSGRMIQGMESMEETQRESYTGASGMIKMLTLIMIVLTIITAMGIVGLASFSVNRRKKQIGTRRALGAAKNSIIRYFMIENLIISGAGVIVGAILTVGLNMILVQAFSLTPIAWYYVPIGMISLLVIGQIAVFGPAQKASSIPPALATRSA